MPHGGRREGAGRKPSEPKRPFRLTEEEVLLIKAVRRKAYVASVEDITKYIDCSYSHLDYLIR